MSVSSSQRPVIGVALKWVDLRPEVDALTGAVGEDSHSFGCSEADQAALEWALRLAERWPGDAVDGASLDPPEVVVVTVGPPEADALVREALAAGATRGVRVDATAGTPSPEVAAALAAVVEGAELVCCGDYSVDRGSGSVPAFLAAELGAVQALGLVDLERESTGTLRVTRRLDCGRRELLAVRAPAVLSFEGASAQLRRAGLAAVLAARTAAIEVRPHHAGRPARTRVTRRSPYRPRARTLPPPPADLDVRGRVLSLTGALVERTPPRTVHVDAAEAADLVIEQLRAWGYLE